MIRWAEMRREPFRVLFPLAVLSGGAGVGHWLLYALGWSPRASAFVHAAIQVGAYMYGFIAGFLLTALPRLTAAPPVTNFELGALLTLYGVQLLGLFMGWPAVVLGSFAGLLVVLALFAVRRVRARRSPAGPPVEFIWLPVGVLSGLVGAGLLLWSGPGHAPAWAIAAGRPMVGQGFLLAIVTGVSGFLAPRLLGRDVWLPPPGIAPERLQAIRRRRAAVHALAGAVFWTSFWVEGAGLIRPAYLLRAAVVTATLLWTTQLVRPPRTPEGYARMLWVSLWAVAAGLWGASLWPTYRVAMLHITFIGGLSLMTFAVGTMVVLGHAGDAPRLRQPLAVLRLVGGGVALALAGRVIADLAPGHYRLALGLAAAAWLSAAAGWFVFVLTRVLRPAQPGAFEVAHEAAKRLHREGAAAGRLVHPGVYPTSYIHGAGGWLW